jgi:hypothetical protein
MPGIDRFAVDLPFGILVTLVLTQCYFDCKHPGSFA